MSGEEACIIIFFVLIFLAFAPNTSDAVVEDTVVVENSSISCSLEVDESRLRIGDEVTGTITLADSDVCIFMMNHTLLGNNVIIDSYSLPKGVIKLAHGVDLPGEYAFWAECNKCDTNHVTVIVK